MQIMAHAAVSASLAGLTLLGAIELGSGQPLIWWDCLALTALMGWLIISWARARGGVFNPYGLFLLSVLAFNAGQVPLEVSGLNDSGLLAGQFSTSTLHSTLLYVGACLIVLHLGALLAVGRRPSRRRSAPGVGANTSSCRRVGCAMILLGLVPALLSLSQSVTVVGISGYIALYGQAAPTSLAAGPQVLGGLLIPGALFLLAGSERRLTWTLLSGIAIGLVAAAHLYIGDRATAILPVVAWLWIFTTLHRRIPSRYLVAGGLVCLVVVFPVIGQLRNLNAADRASVGVATALTSVHNPAFATIAETGNSMATVAATIELIPAHREFDWGVGYGYAALTAFPNLFWKVHPSTAHGDYETWLVRTINPVLAENHVGLGYSILAEAFANFGWLGLLFIGGVGFSVVKLEAWALRGEDVARYAVVAAYLTPLLFWARAESTFEVRGLLWYAIGPYCLTTLLMKWNRVRRSSTSAPSRPTTLLSA
jgi:hypothetical protein